MINITMLMITFVNSTISKSPSPANYSSTAMPQKYTERLQKWKFKDNILKMTVPTFLWCI